ncbi:kinase-like protein [Ganoderma leucocontextum]|nr:kinase-like protein [Ganoderma leucocontextum]
MPIPPDAVPEFSLIQQTRGDEEGLVLTIVKCCFASQETRFVYVVFETNHDVPDAAENKITLWDVDFDNDADQVAYHHAVHDLALSHIFPLLSAVAHDTLLRSPGGIPTFTLSTVDGSVQLIPGMVKSMMETETRWLQRLPSVDTVPDLAPAVVYDIDDIKVIDFLVGGSRGAMLAILPDQPGSCFVTLWIPTFTVFAWSDEDDHAQGILHEMAFLRTIPPHPHIISPPVGYISRVHDGKRVLCGYLVKYYTGGSLGEPERVSAPIATRIKWAYQIASGLHHLHHVGHTYHGDIKLDNVVLDENGDAVLIDFEQGRTNEENAAPELHAASLVSNDTVPRLASRDRPYDIWKDTPRAIEAAEVWSFATVLRPLLSDVDAASAILARCRSEDPNCRPTFGELEEFFQDLHPKRMVCCGPHWSSPETLRSS